MGPREKLGIKENLYIWGHRVLVASFLALLACSGKDSGSCLSPRAESSIYAGDPAANPKDQSTWLTGIQVTTELEPDARGLIVGFRGPNDPEWKDSKPVEHDRAEIIALRIGQGAVVFSTQVMARKGSPSCDVAPASTFSDPQPIKSLFEAGATAPEWP